MNIELLLKALSKIYLPDGYEIVTADERKDETKDGRNDEQNGRNERP